MATIDQLQLRAADPHADREQIYDLTAKVFGAPRYWDWMNACRRSYIEGSHYDWPASTVGFVGEEMVTHWGIWGYRMRIGSAKVRVAGVGAVATHGDYRKQGLMDRTARAGVQRSAEAGYDLSLLYGIGGFYHRFGFVRAWGGDRYTRMTKWLSDDGPAVKLEEFDVAHRDDLARLYNRQNARLTGTAIRPTYTRPSRWHDWKGRLWKNADDAPAGYVVVEVKGHTLHVADLAGEPTQVLTALKTLAREHACDQIDCEALHHDHPLARHLRRTGCTYRTDFFRSGGPMIRTLSLAGTLGKLTGEFQRRLKGSVQADWTGKLVIADPRETVALNIGDGKVQLVDQPGRSRHGVRGGEQIAQLLIGTDDPLEIADAAGLKLTGDAKALLPVLFPAQHPMLAEWDHF